MAGERTWVVVADSKVLRIFEELRRGAALIDRHDLEMRHDEADQVEDADRPTRVFESVGRARHAVPNGLSAHEEEGRRFLKRACAFLAKAGADGLYDKLVLLAPPTALGLIRADLPHAVSEKVADSAHLDVVRESAEQIGARLKNMRLA